ncbi:MAG: flagellin [Allosphingosinicella sp.]|uniref:flagellin N-terminal helical domain-containing protein n=1 Tax=Allosphingosinicella sp. TaxID=2823234 RepID=UPI00396176EE
MISGTRYGLTLEINRQLQLARDIERLQTEISTGKRIQAPSDDPVASARISDLARMQANEAAWSRNLTYAAALSARADTALGSVATGLDRAKELMLAASNGTLSAANRATIASELRAIAEEMQSLIESRDGRGEPLFPTGAALRIPVSVGVEIEAVGSRARMFEGIDTPSGATDLLAILTGAADALAEPDDEARRAAVAASLDALDAAVRHIGAARGEQGARGSRIDALVERLAQSGLQIAEERSAMESANIVEVIARLQARQLTLQAAQAAFARTNQSTLFDLLR